MAKNKAKGTRGSIIQRAPLSRTVIVSYRDQTGKRKQVWATVRADTEKLAQQAARRRLTELLSKLDTGTFVKPSKLTLGDVLDRWLREHAVSHVRPRTYEGYAEYVYKHLIPQIGDVPVAELTSERLNAFYSKAWKEGRRDGRKPGLSPRTVLHIHRVLHNAIGWARKQRPPLVNANVMEAIEAADPPEVEDPEMQVLDPDSIRVFLDAAQGTQWHPLFHLDIHTGMRRSEILGLFWKDIDFDMASLRVERGLHRLKNGAMDYRPPKTKKGRRSIALSPSAVLALRAHREREEALCGEFAIPFTPDRPVFCRIDGTPLLPDSVTQAFSKIAKRVGLVGVHLHSMRHTHATLMMRQGIHPKIVSERLGHSNIGITLDVYSHVQPGLQEAAALRFDEGLTGPAKVRAPAEAVG